MRIGILTQAIEQRGIGSSVAFRCLVENLLAQDPGHDIFLLHYTPAPSETLYQQAEEVILPASPLTASRVIRNLELDIIHYHLGGITTPIWVENAQRVATVHGDAIAFLNLYDQLNWKGRIFSKYIKPRYLRAMDRIFVVSEHSKQFLKETYNLSPQKMLVVYDGVDQVFRPLPHQQCSDVLTTYEIDRPFLFHLSHFGWRKNPQALLRAFSRLDSHNQYQLVIGGKGWGNPQTQHLIQSLNIQEHVLLPGYLPKTDIIKLYNLASGFVFPSRYEGFGMPNVEAMACGCPVISSNVSAIPEIVGDAAILIDDPENTDELTAAMLKLVDNRSLREELRRRGLDRAKQFSWKTSAQQVWEEYSRIGASP